MIDNVLSTAAPLSSDGCQFCASYPDLIITLDKVDSDDSLTGTGYLEIRLSGLGTL